MLSPPPSTSMSNDSMKKQNPSLDKPIFPIQISQTPNSNTNPAKNSKITPDESSMELKKNTSDFNVERAVFWEKEERVPFMFMAKALDAISNESDPVVVTQILCNMLRTVMKTAPGDLVAALHLLTSGSMILTSGSMILASGFPPEFNCNLPVRNDELRLAIAKASGSKVEDVDRLYLEDKHISLVAQTMLQGSSSIPQRPLTVVQVFNTFANFVRSRFDRVNKMKNLLVAATGCEPQYLIYLLYLMQRDLMMQLSCYANQNMQELLKVNLKEQTVLTALGHASLYSEEPYIIKTPHKALNEYMQALDEHVAAEIVKDVYRIVPFYDTLIPHLLLDGLFKLRERCTIAPGLPVIGMTPKKTIRSVPEITEVFQKKEFICEYIYDYPKGLRAMIHMGGGHLKVFSIYGSLLLERRYQDSASLVPHVDSFILDCQLVAYDSKNEEFQPPKRHWFRDFFGMEKVCVVVSDLLYLNGKVLLQKDLKIRRKKFQKKFKEQLGVLELVTTCTSTDLGVIELFLEDAVVKSGCPGLIIKTLTGDAEYEPGKSSVNWLKLRKDYMDYFLPYLDLVPIAALGHSYKKKEQDDEYYIFLLACYDSVRMEFQTVCTMRIKYTSPKLEGWFYHLKVKVITKPKPNYSYPPDMCILEWYDAIQVWQVNWNRDHPKIEVWDCSCHATGTWDPEKGIKLSCPELLRVLAYKDPNQASSLDKVVELCEASKKHYEKNTLGTGGGVR